jgi:hypothetical protein
MNKKLLISAIGILIGLTSLRSQIFTEHFAYPGTGNPAIDTLSVISIPPSGSTPNWLRSLIGNSSVSPILQKSSGLGYGAYPKIGGSINLDISGENVYRSFPISFNGSRFMSFILVVDSASNTGNPPIEFAYVNGIGTQTSQMSTAACLQVRATSGSTFQLGLGKSQLQTWTTWGGSYSYGDTLFIVMRYEFFLGGFDDQIKLYVYTNNTMPPTTDPNFGSINYVNNGQSIDANDISRIHLRQENGLTPKCQLDFIRYGTTWADVTSIPPSASLDQLTNKTELSISPNPIEGNKIQISTNDAAQYVHYVITDITGRELLKGNIKPLQKNKVDIQLERPFPKGTYYLKMIDNKDQVQSTKIVVP